jgi:hypothetical protein
MKLSKPKHDSFGSEAVIRSLLGFGERAGYLDLNIKKVSPPIS